MFIYFILIVLIIFCGMLFEKKNKMLYSVLMFLIFTLIASFRHYLVGTDTENYVRAFNNVLYNFELYGANAFNLTRFEKGFTFLMLFIRKITMNYTIYFIIVYSFINFSICRFIRKYSDNMCLSFILFFFSRCFFSEMNIMRQYIAIAIFLFAIKYIEEKKAIKYILLIVIAAFFHKSAIILLPIYFMNRLQLNRKEKIIGLIGAIVISLFFNKILNALLGYIGAYSGYVESFYDSNKIGSVIGFIMNLAIYIFISILISKSKDNVAENVLYKMLFINVLLSFLCIRISVLSRITDYFSIVPLILIPNAIKKFENKNTRIILTVLIVGLFCGFFGVISYYRPNWNTCIPYLFFWQR